MDWLDLLAVQRTLKSLLQHHSSKASILQHSAFFTVQLSHPYVTTGKTIALTRRTFVGKVMSLLFNMLSRLVITFLPRSKCLLISWLQLPSAVILEPPKNEIWHCFHCFLNLRTSRFPHLIYKLTFLLKQVKRNFLQTHYSHVFLELALLLRDFIVNYPCLCSLSPGHMDSRQFSEEHLDKTLSSF